MKPAKELLQGLKEAFNTIVAPAAPVAPAQAAAPAQPAAPAPAAPKTYKTKDGVELSIAQAGEAPAVGDQVLVNGTPPAEGTIFILEDGSSIAVDAAGKISAITPADPVTNDLNNVAAPAQAAPAVVAPVSQYSANTPDELKSLVDSFASGSAEERIAKLEVVCRALMESCMGYELREAERKLATEQAIEIYKTDLKTAQASLAKHEQTIQGLFDVCEQLTAVPSADPATLTGVQKDRFEKTNKKEERLAKFREALKESKKEHNK